jgi:hypothetical protein
MSIQLEMARKGTGSPLIEMNAKDWVKIRQATPLFGYPTVEEAEQQLTEFLFGKGVKLED